MKRSWFFIYAVSVASVAWGSYSTEQIKEWKKQAVEQNWTFDVNENPSDEIPLEQGTGLVVPENWESLAPWRTVTTDEVLPAKFDWREKGIGLNVKNQGRCGSCWAFGTVAAMEGAIKLATGRDVVIAEQQLVNCRPSFGSCGGGYFALGFYKEKGANYENDFPYVARNGRCKSGIDGHEKVKEGAEVGQRGREPSTEELKSAIHRFGPVGVTVSVSGAFSGYKSGVYNACTQRSTNHIVALVGWNDEDQTWIMKNSWGEKWGEKGFMRIRYTNARGAKCNRVAQSAVYGVYSEEQEGK